MNTVRLRYLAEVNPPTPAFDKVANDAPVTFMPLETVWADDRLDTSRTRPKSEVAGGYMRFQDSDVLCPKVTPTFQAGRTAIVSGLVNGVGAATTEVHVLRSKPTVADPRYVRYALLTKPFLEEGVSRFQGVAGLQRVPEDFLQNFRVNDRPLREQRRIADFLDDQVARIDEAMALKQREIVAREERSARSLSEFVARCDDWVPLRRVMSRWIDYRGATPNKSNDGVRLVTAKNIRGGRIEIEPEEFIATTDHDSWMTRGLPRQGDVLLTTEAPLGEVAQVSDPGIALAQRVILMRPDEAACQPKWLYWGLQSGQLQGELARHATGSTALGIKADRLRGVAFPLPALTDQARWVDALDAEQERRVHLVAAVWRSVGLLEERKRSLITAAVTGELDVSSASLRASEAVVGV